MPGRRTRAARSHRVASKRTVARRAPAGLTSEQMALLQRATQRRGLSTGQANILARQIGNNNMGQYVIGSLEEEEANGGSPSTGLTQSGLRPNPFVGEQQQTSGVPGPVPQNTPSGAPGPAPQNTPSGLRPNPFVDQQQAETPDTGASGLTPSGLRPNPFQEQADGYGGNDRNAAEHTFRSAAQSLY